MSEDRRKNMNENIKQEAKTLEEAARPCLMNLQQSFS